MFIYSTASFVFQVTRAILENPNDKTKVHLIYANVTYEDILLKVICISIALLFIVIVALLQYSKTELHIDMVHLSLIDYHTDLFVAVCMLGTIGLVHILIGHQAIIAKSGE